MIDVQRDIMDIYLISGEEQIDSEFFLSLEEWTETHMKIKTNFTDPMAISSKSTDKFKFKIKNPGLFISKASGQTMSLNSTDLEQETTIPR